MSEPAKPHPIGARPSVLSLNINSKSALYAAYMPYLKRGGIFVPTAKPYTIGDEVFMLLSLMDEPGKLPIAGSVVWGYSGWSPKQQDAGHRGPIQRRRVWPGCPS